MDPTGEGPDRGESMAYFYDRLSVMDNTSLLSETPRTPMHVAGIEVFEAGPLRTTDGGIDIGKIRAAYAGFLHRIRSCCA